MSEQDDAVGNPAAKEPKNQRPRRQIEPGHGVEEESQDDQDINCQDSGPLEESEKVRVGFLAARGGYHLKQQQNGCIDHRQTGQLAEDELQVAPLPQPPEDRHLAPVPLGVVKSVLRIHRVRSPQGKSMDLYHWVIALTL